MIGKKLENVRSYNTANWILKENDFWRGGGVNFHWYIFAVNIFNGFLTAFYSSVTIYNILIYVIVIRQRTEVSAIYLWCDIWPLPAVLNILPNKPSDIESYEISLYINIVKKGLFFKVMIFEVSNKYFKIIILSLE